MTNPFLVCSWLFSTSPAPLSDCPALGVLGSHQERCLGALPLQTHPGVRASSPKWLCGSRKELSIGEGSHGHMQPEPHRYCLLPYVYRSYIDLGLSSHQLLESMLK